MCGEVAHPPRALLLSGHLVRCLRGSACTGTPMVHRYMVYLHGMYTGVRVAWWGIPPICSPSLLAQVAYRVYRHPAHPPRARHLGLHPPLPLISPFRRLRGMADSAPRGALPHTPQTLSSLIHPPCSALLLSSHLPSGQVAERVSGCSNPCGTGPLSASPLTLASHLPSGRCLSAGGGEGRLGPASTKFCAICCRKEEKGRFLRKSTSATNVRAGSIRITL